jgi:septum formation protein
MSGHPFVPWPDDEVLVLASASPRRAELLGAAGLPFDVVPADDVEEPSGDCTLTPGADPAVYARDLAVRKARAVSEQQPDRLVLGADTIVILDDSILEKPRDRVEAAAMLSRLSGRRHTVITAIALCRAGHPVWVGHERTEVTFLAISPAAIDRYVATGEPMDKAGAYGIQGFGAMMVSRVDGCYFNVMGLPLALLGSALREHLTRSKEIA